MHISPSKPGLDVYMQTNVFLCLFVFIDYNMGYPLFLENKFVSIVCLWHGGAYLCVLVG